MSIAVAESSVVVARGEQVSAAAGTIRPCLPGDMGEIASLFQRTFRKGGRTSPQSTEAYLRQLFFEHPWQDPELNSLVFVGPNGMVGGFIGVLPLRLLLNGTPIRAAVSGALMVDSPAENPLAGARLMRSFLTGPQEVSISESANAVSQRMWVKLGGKALANYSMEWLRILRPGGFAVEMLRQRASVARVLRPVGSGIDAIASRIKNNPLRLSADEGGGAVSDADVEGEEIIDAILALSADYPVRPQWDQASLTWLMSNAAIKEGYGALRRRVVYGKNRAPVGCYLYYGKPRGIAFVLQILARPDAAGAVIDSLFQHAYDNGAVAVRGRTQPELADAILRRRSIFLRVASTLVDTKNAPLLATLRSGDGLITGLAGEAWTRLIDGTFV